MKVGREGRYCLDAHIPLCIALTGNTECLESRFASDAAPAAPEYVGFEQLPVFARAVALVR